MELSAEPPHQRLWELAVCLVATGVSQASDRKYGSCRDGTGPLGTRYRLAYRPYLVVVVTQLHLGCTFSAFTVLANILANPLRRMEIHSVISIEHF
jgi:hypothetical protein